MLVGRRGARGSTQAPTDHRAEAVALFREPVRLDAGALEVEWRRMWQWRPPLHVEADLSGAETVFRFQVETTRGDVTFFAERYPHDLAAAAETSPLWPGSMGPLDDVEHAVVSLHDHRSSLEAARWLTRVVATLLGVAEPIGVLWAGRVLTRADTFLDLAQTEDTDLPVGLWVTSQALPVDGRPGLVTTGLTRLGVPEIEARGGGLEAADLRTIVVGLARHLLGGHGIADGHAMPGPGRSRLVVRHARSALGRSGRVYRVEPV